MIPESSIMIWLVKSLIDDIFETNIWTIFVKCSWNWLPHDSCGSWHFGICCCLIGPFFSSHVKCFRGALYAVQWRGTLSWVKPFDCAIAICRSQRPACRFHCYLHVTSQGLTPLIFHVLILCLGLFLLQNMLGLEGQSLRHSANKLLTYTIQYYTRPSCLMRLFARSLATSKQSLQAPQVAPFALLSEFFTFALLSSSCWLNFFPPSPGTCYRLTLSKESYNWKGIWPIDLKFGQ